MQGKFGEIVEERGDPPPPKWRIWIGPALSAVPVLVMFISGAMKLIQVAPEVESWGSQLGYPMGLMMPIGVLEVVCVAVYVIPRTAVLGAILMTGFLAGAAATQVRVGDPAAIGPILLAALVWAGLYFRDERIRALLPLVKPVEG